jgi:hypothetical protein
MCMTDYNIHIVNKLTELHNVIYIKHVIYIDISI